MVQEKAVIVRNAVKHYGSQNLVLNGMNMTISTGSIYGLLGASGCGKTTLLSCIVGVRLFNSGELWVLGGQPGSKGSGIPGPRVGYMPQETSLVGEFTVSNALYYFGRINGLEEDEIDARQRFLSDLLQLPPTDHLVKNMSGGQKRRISFAAALIHRPKLLILDEPTVGLDPVLREKIWDYLIRITQEQGTTVLITTHYIEEAKDADTIGLMRNGRLMAESSPQQLLERCQCECLEEAFLQLSQSQNNTVVTNFSKANKSKSEDTDSDSLYQDKYRRTKNETTEYKANSKYKVSSLKKFKALMVKNSIQFVRYYTGVVFAMLFPILQVSVFFIGIGRNPKGLTIGVINKEAGNCDYGNNLGNIWYDKEQNTCNFSNLSCKFLHYFDNSIATQKYYDDISEATDAVHNGKLSGVMYFSRNFSEAMQTRIDDLFDTKEVDIINGQIQVSLDMSDRQIGLFLKSKLYNRFFDIYEDVMKECGYPLKFGNLPIQFENPIFGTKDFKYEVFMAPVYIVTLAFFLATVVSTTLIITDRAEGIWNRSLVQGVTTTEILMSHFLAQTIIVIIQTIMMMCMCFVIWGLECKGSIFAVLSFVFLNGLNGLMYGFFISVMSTNHTMAHYASAGSFFPLITLCGCLWPVEGMPKVLRYISYILPTTWPGISLREVIDKGHSVTNSQVYTGFLVICGWILFFFIITIIGLKKKST